MPVLTILLNALWLLLGGVELALGWILAGVLMAITIIGLPWARAAFNFAFFVVWPFGRTAVSRKAWSGEEDLGTGPLGLIGNVIWFILAGWWLAIGHVLVALLLALTIIGIPFALQHLKLAGMSLTPIGKVIVDKDEAARRGLG